MLQAVLQQIQQLLGVGLDISEVGALQMALRTFVIFLFTLVIVRLGSKRFLGKMTAFDVVVGIMLGSVMSRGINGSAPFVPTLVAGVVLLGLHWSLAVLSFHISWFGPLVKGDPVSLIKDGRIQWRGMRRGSITCNDLAEALRVQTKQTDPTSIESAVLERDGRISVVPYKKEPRVIEKPVHDGVQTIRIEME